MYFDSNNKKQKTSTDLNSDDKHYALINVNSGDKKQRIMSDVVRTDSVDRENEGMNSVPYLSLSLSLEDAPLLDMSTDCSAGSE